MHANAFSFPIINKMTSVFACTSDRLVDTSVAQPYPLLCNLNANVVDSEHATCMDIVNNVQCWTPEHMKYVLPPLFLLDTRCPETSNASRKAKRNIA